MKHDVTTNNDAVDFEALVQENTIRNAALHTDYDPISGIGCCGTRVRRYVPDFGEAWVPEVMAHDEPEEVFGDATLFRLTRVRYDFEFWAAECARISDKRTRRLIPLRLNAPQRRVLAVLERQRADNRPIRMILLKARQWGGSTLVQTYMAWMQIVRRENWNSMICGHLANTSAVVHNIFDQLVRNYPEEYLPDGKPLKFRSFRGLPGVRELEGRGCLVAATSARSQDAIRGYDIAMAHMTEVAFWPSSPQHTPQDVVRAITGTVAHQPDTVVVYESTADGVGSFFHEEWLRAKAGLSGYEPVFVPWHEIEIYRLPVNDVRELWASLDDYERQLWRDGCTLEMIAWYHEKRREFASHDMMMAEYPSNDVEAFAHTGRCLFDLATLDRLRDNCRAPRFTGDIGADFKTLRNVHFMPADNGKLRIWQMPEYGAGKRRYMVTVDVGGRSENSDFSVIAVIDFKNGDDERPEVVAQWRGHIDHDLLAWKAAQIATFYDKALLVVESNTLETETDNGDFVLDEISTAYGKHIYRRETGRLGFQTNRKTKREAVYRLVARVREDDYIERDSEAVNEMSWFEEKTTGGYGAVEGKHDDILMTRCIAFHVAKQPTWSRRFNAADFRA